jgi:hypothetical protein
VPLSLWLNLRRVVNIANFLDNDLPHNFTHLTGYNTFLGWRGGKLVTGRWGWW